MPTFPLKQDLAESEIAKLGGELAKALSEKERVEAQKKIAVEEFKSKLDGLVSRIHELKDAIESGTATIDVEVEEVPGDGVIHLHRLDTGLKVGERPMSLADRQQTLGLSIGGAEKLIGDARDRSEEQEAETPAEAEAQRIARLEAEHAERNAAAIEAVRGDVTVTALDGGAFLAALSVPAKDGSGTVELRETGETEDGARAEVLAAYGASLPKFEAPPTETVTWDDVVATSQALTEATGSTAETPAELPRVEDAPPVRGLKAPKGARGKRLRIQDQEGNEVTAESPPLEVPPAPESAPRDLCEPFCETAHEHTEQRTEF